MHKRRKRENKSFLAMSPVDDMDETIKIDHHQNNNLLPNSDVVSENEDDNDMFTQESDNEEVQGQVSTNEKEILRKKAKRADKVQFDYEHAHRMRLQMGTSQVDVLDILNQTVEP